MGCRLRPFKGRWKGKSVRIRRGPATVTGDARRGAQAQPLIGRSADREGAEGRPGSQETCLRPQAHKALVERGWLHVFIHSYSAGILCCSTRRRAGVPKRRRRPAQVNLRVEGSSETLFEGPVTTEAEEISALRAVVPNPVSQGLATGARFVVRHHRASRDARSGMAGSWSATWSSEIQRFLVFREGRDQDVEGRLQLNYAFWAIRLNDTDVRTGRLSKSNSQPARSRGFKLFPSVHWPACPAPEARLRSRSKLPRQPTSAKRQRCASSGAAPRAKPTAGVTTMIGGSASDQTLKVMRPSR